MKNYLKLLQLSHFQSIYIFINSHIEPTYSVTNLLKRKIQPLQEKKNRFFHELCCISFFVDEKNFFR